MTTKDAVLEQLIKSGGNHLSGAKLAQELCLSRTAVWKAIEELRRDGYQISAVTNRGYTLIEQGDRLSLPAIRSFLRRKAIAEQIRLYPSLVSTNQTAKQLALEGAPAGTIVLAGEQTGGRGRRGRSFFSPSGTGVYFTVIFRSELAADRAVMITTAASVAAARAIDKVTGGEPHAQIKWINDIYLGGKKICGILTDAVANMENGSFEYIVVGIGINTNNKTEDFPEEFRDRAGSLFSVTGKKYDRNRMAAALADEIADILPNFSSGEYLKEYRSRSCVLGHSILIFGAGHDGTPATAVDIDEHGYLLARGRQGELYTLNSGEITIRAH